MLSALLLAVLIVFMTVSVISRYALNVGMAWSDEASRLLFVWIVFLGVALGVRHRNHIFIEWFVQRLPGFWPRAAALWRDLLILAFSAFFTWQSVTTVRFSLLQKLPALRISIAWLYVSSLVAGVLMTIYAIANLVETIRGEPAHPDQLGRASMERAE